MSQNFAVDCQSVTKTYGEVTAVKDLTFQVEFGEIFGMLGPNGAGKTTTIRMALDIIKPTSGKIDILGGSMSEVKKARIGYLPEERGLYEEMGLLDTLVYLGQLKGLSGSVAKERGEKYLRKVELWESKDKKVKELSRGMRQKAQFAVAVLHEPDLIIIDEPFSGLDPVNTRLIKELILQLRADGSAIIMSTHMMHQVEELCSRILLMNKGTEVLYGPLEGIRNQFAGNSVEIGLIGQMPDLQGVQAWSRKNGKYRLVLEKGTEPDQILKELVSRPELKVDSFERVQTSLDEIFVKVVGEKEVG